MLAEDGVGEPQDAENPTPIDKAQLEMILKDPCANAIFLKKMGLGEDATGVKHLTPSGTNMGGWPPYPLGPPYGWPGLSRPITTGQLLHARSPCPARGRKSVDWKASRQGFVPNQTQKSCR